ncbi:viperin family antiviral radical SAM protein [Methanosarcina sp. KYL-1]|uniref:viperin family antiviral radical SAM protein n=1 Tax=Methanosarcina sp. KYL-1 TaxID=2602068 RepID=UPI0021014D39|nr:viperin family antiviral radical SAM protein [Methanosarcina sp. KYL-1]
MIGDKRIRSVNWHITTKCNYKCRFCYVQKLDREILDMKEACSVLSKLKAFRTDVIDIEKINFVGGEPFLHPLFYELLQAAHEMGFVVSIVTNGSMINEKNIHRIAKYVDWVGVSVDSVSNLKEARLGRGMGHHVSHAVEVADLVHEYGIKLKVNTTVTKPTCKENMEPLIQRLKPHRWKVFQMLHIEGQNDGCVRELAVTDSEFQNFTKRHEHISLIGGEKPVFESNEDMIGSYFILSPSGKVISNEGGSYGTFEFEEFLEKQTSVINIEKYVNRGGLYEWADLTTTGTKREINEKIRPEFPPEMLQANM